MLAKEQSQSFPDGSPVAITLYRVSRQMPHYHEDALEIIMCLKGTIEVYSMHEKHVLHAGDLKEADTYDIHSVTATDDSDNLVVSFHFDLNHPLFAGQGYELLYYVCSSDGIDASKKPAMDHLRAHLLALLEEDLSKKTDRKFLLSGEVLKTLRKSFQYFNDINLDDSYSENMQRRFEHIIAYMLENYRDKSRLVSSAQIYKHCAITVAEKPIQNSRVVCAQAADDLLSIEDTYASFVISSIDVHTVNISARSFGKLNVQVLMEKLGGGGHQTMAAAQIVGVSLQEAKEQLIQVLEESLE